MQPIFDLFWRSKITKKRISSKYFPIFYQNFTLGPDPSSKFLKDTLSRGLTPALKFDLGAWPQRLVLGPGPRDRGSPHRDDWALRFVVYVVTQLIDD